MPTAKGSKIRRLSLNDQIRITDMLREWAAAAGGPIECQHWADLRDRVAKSMERDPDDINYDSIQRIAEAAGVEVSMKRTGGPSLMNALKRIGDLEEQVIKMMSMLGDATKRIDELERAYVEGGDTTPASEPASDQPVIEPGSQYDRMHISRAKSEAKAQRLHLREPKHAK